MKESIETYLIEDEKVLWSADVEKFVPLDNTYKSKFVKTVVVSVVAFVVLSLLYIKMTQTNGIEVMPWLIIAIAVAAIAPILGFFRDASKLSKSSYVITDKRLLIIRDEAKGVSFNAIKEAEFRTDADGHVSLLCGADARALKDVQIRNRAAIGDAALDGGVCRRFVWYAVPEAEKVKAILSSYINIA